MPEQNYGLIGKLDFFAKHECLTLILIGAAALVVRLCYFPYNIPITLDGLLYFWYANDTAILGHFPTDFYVENNGWPAFLAIFFTIFHLQNFLDYMELQRLITILLSVVTIVPLYFLCKRFFGSSLAIIGVIVFAFEPRIIQNSLLGIIEPLYLFLVTLSLFLCFSSNKKLVYASFGIAALATLVRAEGLFLFFALTIQFFIQNRKSWKNMAKYSLALFIFVLVLLPMVVVRFDLVKQDSIISRLPRAGNEIVVSSDNKGGFANFIGMGSWNFTKLFGWAMIPSLIFFVPLGLILIIKKRDSENLSILLTTIILLMPAYFAMLNNSDVRFLFPAYPLFCLIGLNSVKFLNRSVKHGKIILFIVLITYLISSVVFLEFKNIDSNHEMEALSLANEVVKRTSVLNKYSESKYVDIALIDQQKFPGLRNEVTSSNIQTVFLNANSLNEYLGLAKENKLTHLVIDEESQQPFLKDVFLHDERYNFLEKIYDSHENGYQYHLKIYKIDYSKLNLQ